jgi:methionine biosynthesis protein MetW
MSGENKNIDHTQHTRLDHRLICRIIEPQSRVLDLGCGCGDLLKLLKREKNVRGQGIELKEDAIFQCVEKGLSVFHMDFDSGLSSYPDDSFDYVILNHSLQETLHVELVLQEALRVGKKVVLGFPNFAHIRSRMQLFFRGRTPVTPTLPYLWYNTPNLHFLSISDFKRYASERGINVITQRYLSSRSVIKRLPNLFAVSAIFVVCVQQHGA